LPRTLVFFYPQLKKLTGAERLILKLASYVSEGQGGDAFDPVLLTHRFAPECRPALADHVKLEETGWRMRWTGNHYLDAAIEYALGPLLALRIPRDDLAGVIFFGPPSVPAMLFTRRVLLPLKRLRVPVLYFCFEPPRFIYSDTNDILRRLPLPTSLVKPLLGLYRRIDRAMVGTAHRVLSNSPYGSRRIHNAYGRRATVIPHGVDFSPPSRLDVVKLRGRYGLGERPVAVTVNHLHPRKRIDLFLRTMFLTKVVVPGAAGLIVGDGPEREPLERQARQLGLEPGLDVIFTGPVDEAELPAHYAAGDVYVHTGRAESFGLSVIEALSLGLPVVSVDDGGPRDTVQHGVSGYLVDPGAVYLSEALSGLLNEPERVREMGRRGADFIRSNYSWELGASTLRRVLGEVARKIRGT
jgi:glycosyltransferase involved in cell wall biosynthesis